MSHHEGRAGRGHHSRKRVFAKDLRLMMYGFGDVANPDHDTVNVLEEMVVDYISDMCHQAARLSSKGGKVTVDDFKFVLRNDGKKLARVEELIRMSEDIKAARKIVNMPEFETLADGGKPGRGAGGSAGADTFG
ncbi:transcription initiation factor IID, 18kD subunit-domain-containing protein [Thamnocephalis sphaerospora]|uniref:Transcription initiation factor TFIID subunit 13 n=1 Tax=Thamnocephalis sphaerospora TaxID=78915 RepID=A0A4P9XRI7_9FUNG|nr:transcription initiation factor IID, 18kD subunit-domain-containing protein [Thamnocephalis sphaerospora]|eukprot:RKP08704.1 transcription initiation factor IID, 18kD subunit-domain-containing protein [Thamnocephalis sphaerospora]